MPNRVKYATRIYPVQDKLLTVQQIAAYLRVDRFTVYRLLTQKRIPAFKVGNQWRFKKQLIDEWLLRNANFDK
jgi:excisionase family DNA binding protein